MKKIGLLSGLAVLSLLGQNSFAQDEPLLIEGKSSIYQRVLTTPSCRLMKSPADKNGSTVDAFTRFYVYERENGLIKVGPDDSGKISGYLSDKCTVDWKMQTALMFTNPANRNRALVFKTKDALNSVIESPDPAAKMQPLMKKALSGQYAEGVVSIEPENYIDYKNQFYLLPILDFEETMFDDGNYVRELKIASVTKNEGQSSKNDEDNQLKIFKAAIVFVIDSSISMQPYIDRTKETIQTITKSIHDLGLSSNVHFGLVSFRSNTKVTPALEYTSKVFVKPGAVTDEKEFENKLSSLNQAKVSSKYFDEDSFAGISTALDEVDWSEYGGRYIVLITDAGGIKGSDKLSSTGLDSKELRVEADHKGVAIYTMHLLTDSGKRNSNHEKARAQYMDLSYNQTISKSLYYPVNAGNVDSFGKMIDSLSNNITKQVKLLSEGKSAVGEAMTEESDSQMEKDTVALGYAMQLAYLGEKLGTSVPPFMTGWIADRDLASHDRATSTPVVLLTKGELSSLKDITSRILDTANQGILEPEQMFSQLRSIAVSLGRDPSTISKEKTLKLNELGLLGEFIEDLPYKSRIQELDEDTWSSMGPDEQNQTIEDLENKLRYYQQCNDDAARWIQLNKDEDSSEAVYPVPLEVLP
ncbi:MAG: vWA domain-containing protein [Succinivibrio sp.]